MSNKVLYSNNKILYRKRNDFNINGFNDAVWFIEQQPDNKMLISGDFTSYNNNSINKLVRIYPDGNIDDDFVNNLGSGFNEESRSITIQSDNKIVLAGYFTTFNGNSKKYLIRLNSDGTEDTTFYNNLTSWGDGSGVSSNLFDVKIQSDGKILVGGAIYTLNGDSRNYLIRLNSDGTEDTTFYNNLTSWGDGSAFNNAVNKIIIQPDNKILIVGQFTSLNGQTRNYIVRLNSDGTEDTNFYTNIGNGANEKIWSILLQSDNKIIIGGGFTQFNNTTHNHIIRLNSDGTEDTAFYTNLTSWGDGSAFGSSAGYGIYSIINVNDKIYIGGYYGKLNNVKRYYLVSLNNDGTENDSFYNNLISTGDGSGLNNQVRTLKDDLNGNIFVGGYLTKLNGDTRNRIVKLNYEGYDLSVKNNIVETKILRQ